MFKITTKPPTSALFPSQNEVPSSHRKHPAELEGMDIDDHDFGGPSNLAGVVTPGEVITSAKEFMRGHGTYVEDESVVSSVTGTIEKVNKLISVRALKARYTPEVGDLVIGRIVEVGPSRWKVDANARQDAILMLSSVNLPGGIQRRKIESDALKMREFLAEGDLLVAEVQALMGDGAMSLHTRSLKYGKLRNGHLLTLPPRLIRRLKSHFHHLPPPCGPTGVDIILGLNGFVWVSSGTIEERREGGEGFDAEGVYSDKNDDIPAEGRKAIATVASILSTFAQHNIPITDGLINDAYAWVQGRGIGHGPLSSEEGDRLMLEVVDVDVSA